MQRHFSKKIHIEMCVCTLLNANPVVERVGAHALEGKNNFPIEGEPSHLEINSIFSPSMPILNVFEPISKPILDPNKSFYAPSTKLHDDPRNPSRHPKNRSHENYRNTQEEQQQ